MPVGTLATNPTLASAFHLKPTAKAKKREQALAAHLRGASGKKALTKKLLDIGALVAARGILAKGDVSAACAVAKQRRTDPAAVLPAKVRAAVEAWLATVSGGEGRAFYISPFPGRRRPRRRRRGAVYTPPPLRRPGEGCLERLSNQTPISN